MNAFCNDFVLEFKIKAMQSLSGAAVTAEAWINLADFTWDILKSNIFVGFYSETVNFL